MATFFKIAGISLGAIGYMIFNPLFWFVIIITALVHKRNSKMEFAMLGYSEPLWRKVLNSLLAGLLAGILGSSISVFLGITIEQYMPNEGVFGSGILYIWGIALLLSLLNQRYLCFSYAGGIVALTNLIIGYPNINAIGILALVGILHLAESLLIFIDGHSNAIPGFFKLKDGKIVGGFFMNRVWPLPVLIFFITFLTGNVVESVAMPDWWPIIKQPGLRYDLENIMYILQPIPVVLGYGDIAITKDPASRCKDSSLRLAAYSIVLICLCVIASKVRAFAYIAALFSPIGHELLILYGQNEEELGVHRFVHSDEGLMVLYSKKDFPGSKMKIGTGDLIISINNNETNNEEHLNEVLKDYPTYIWLDIIKNDGTKKTVEYKDYVKGIGDLGIIFATENPKAFFEIKKSLPLVDKIRDRLNKIFRSNS